MLDILRSLWIKCINIHKDDERECRNVTNTHPEFDGYCNHIIYKFSVRIIDYKIF